MTPQERELIERAVAVTGEDLTKFVVTNVVAAARRALADRETFVLDAEQRTAWAGLNARPVRELAGVKRLLERPSPFTR